MRIRPLSDLHLEHQGLHVSEDGDEDVVILAGDIHTGLRGLEWAASTFTRSPVIYVMGNHEFYSHDASLLIAQARERAKELGIHLLENQEIRLGGHRFLGCTLWSGFDSVPGYSWIKAAREAHVSMADYGEIYNAGRPITPSTQVEWYERSLAWLTAMLDPEDPAVVVTHFAPTLHTSNPRYGRNDPLTPYFNNALDDLLGQSIPLWIHGHTHWSSDVVVSGPDSGHTTRIISNQRGYPGENLEFDPELRIEIQSGEIP